MIKNKKLLRIGAAVLAVLLALTVLIVDSNTRIVTTEYDVSSARLPAGFEGMRIVQLTDLHGAVFGKNNDRLIKAVQEARPDIICLTGDVFDDHTPDEYAPELCRRLMTIAPVYYVTGNHEYSPDANTWKILGEVAKTGVFILRDEYRTLERSGDKIIIAGAEDHNGVVDEEAHESFFNELFSLDDYTLLLHHRNNKFDKWVQGGVELVLCGHAHGGIWRLPLVGGLLFHREDLPNPRLSGCFTKDNTTMIVSRGLGNSGSMMRFFNNPQIVVIELHTGGINR